MNAWQWQLARLLQNVEDIFTMGYKIPDLRPMLENAGANVFVPRERDPQIKEVIVDNDDTSLFFYEETNGNKNSWKKGEYLGFADTKDDYNDKENPFTYGTYRQIASKKNGKAFAEWTPDIPEKGKYSVYISYKSLPESVKDAKYTVYHYGGETDFIVNNNMCGSTWIYLGSFDFDKGIYPDSV